MESEVSDRDLLLSLDRSFSPPRDCGDGRCRDFFPEEFIYIVVVPAAVVVLVVHLILISLCVCCCINRRKHRVVEREDDLAVFEAIRRASAGVRRMSHGTTTPLLGDSHSRRGSVSNVRNDHRRRPRDSCHSAPGTLQRHNRNRDSNLFDSPPPPPPPPYGAPPEYLMGDEDDAFLEPGIQLQEFPPDEDDLEPRENNQQHHHHHRRHHRRQRPYSAANGYMTR